MIGAIIFDMDGVIVDTEYVEFGFLKEFIHNLNNGSTHFSDDELSILVGKSYKDLYTTISSFTGNRFALDEISQRYGEFITEKFSTLDYLDIFRHDIMRVINFCKDRNIKLAVASSSRKLHIEDILTACNIKDCFDLIVSGEQFQISKPNPEIYKYTTSELGVDAKNAIAIEDSYSGILSAKSAGLNVIAYKEIRLPIDQSQADYIAENMLDVYAIINKQF